MKTTFLLSTLLLASTLAHGQEMVRVSRWKSPVTQDFETIPESRNPDSQLQSWGYSLKTYQYSAYKTRPDNPDAVGVYRWTMPNCAASVVYAEHETSDEWLLSRGYKDKELMFYALKNRPATGDFVAVSRWMNTKAQTDPCRGYTLSIAEHELTTEQLVSYGYTNSRVQFYVPRPGSRNGSVTPGNTNTTAQTIRLNNIDEWLCPQRTRGDSEFGGHGPRIKSEVRLRVGDGGRALYADITFWAQETEHDWSTAEGRWTRKVYDAPYGKRIARILSDRASRTQFISPPGGFQFLVPGADVAKAVSNFTDGLGGTITNAVFALHGLPAGDYAGLSRLVTGRVNNGNTEVRVPAIEGTLVRFFTIVGDTGGDDISHDDNCNDDTRIVKIEFAPVRVELANSQN
jgi:hypothetical protein